MEELLKDINAWQLIWTIIAFLIGAIINGRLTAYKVRAELKAKTRLQWIEDVRKITAEIIVLYYKYMIHAKQIQEEFDSKIENINDKVKIEEIKKRQVEKFHKKSVPLIIEISEKRALYKLYFSTYTKKKWFNISKFYFWKKSKSKYKNHNKNHKMHNLVDGIFDDIVMTEEKIVEKMLLINEEAKGMYEFIDETSFYLKVEWDRAKKNK